MRAGLSRTNIICVWQELCLLELEVLLKIVKRAPRSLQGSLLLRTIKTLDIGRQPFTVLRDLTEEQEDIRVVVKKLSFILDVKEIRKIEKEVLRLYPYDGDSINQALSWFYSSKRIPSNIRSRRK